MNESTSQSVQTLWQRIKELVTLRIEYTKLTVAEKLTMILAMVALGFLGIFMVMFALFFLSLGLADWIGESLGMAWGSLIVAGIYIVLLLIVIALRKPLFINPISRFITRMML